MSAWYRRFYGADDIKCAIGACNLTGAFTMAALCRWNNPDEPPDNAIIVNHKSSVAPELILYTEAYPTCPVAIGIAGDSGSPAFNDSNDGTCWQFEDGWAILAATKTAGTSTTRMHLCKNGVWTHANSEDNGGGVTMGNPESQATGNIRFGSAGGFVFTWVDLAVAAEWTTALSDADIESLFAHNLTQDWLDLDPAGCWRFGQKSVSEPVEDLTGNGANQLTVTGTQALESSTLTWGRPARPPIPLSGTVFPHPDAPDTNLQAEYGFETTISGYVNDVGTVVQSSEQAHSGTYSAKVTRTASGSGIVDCYDNNSSRWAAAAPGPYTAAVWVRPTVTRNFYISFLWRDAAKAHLDANDGAPVSLPANQWTLLEDTLVAPTGTHYLVPIVYGQALAQNEVVYIDDWYTGAGTRRPTLDVRHATGNEILIPIDPAGETRTGDEIAHLLEAEAGVLD